MRAAAVLGLLLLAPLPLSAQGLGDAAARERQKRQGQRESPARVFTDQDLRPPAAATPAEGGDDLAADAPAEADAAPAEADAVIPRAVPGPAPEGSADTADPLEKERRERKLLEAEWRVRFANAREQLAVAEENSWVEVIRTEFVAGVPVQMRVKEQVETEELKRSRQAMADLEEEFRRTGLPPGWAREP